MSFEVGNYTVAYLRVLITDPIIDKPVILQLAATLENESLFQWIKPSEENLIGTIAAENGLKRICKHLLLHAAVLPTKRSCFVVQDLLTFMESQKPILLVTYSTQREMELFFEIIRKNSYVYMFDDVIKGVVNTLPIFEKKYPELDWEGRVDLPMVAERAFRRDCKMGYLDTSRYLEVLDELVTTFISPSELIENCKPWREFFPDIIIMAPKNPLRMPRKKPLKAAPKNPLRMPRKKPLKAAPKNPLIKAPISDLLKEIIEANEKIEARLNEDDPIEKKLAGSLDPESSGSLVEGQIPVQQFRDHNNLYEQLLINQDRRPNTSDSFVAQQHEIIRKNRRRNNDVAFGSEPGDLNPQSRSRVEEQGPQFPDWQNSDEQLLISQDRRRITSDSFAAKQQAIPRKIHRPNNYVAFTREPEDLNTESGLLVEEQDPQFPDWQNSDDQFLTNQDQSDKYDRFSALGEDIPQEIHQFIGEYEARRDSDYQFQRQPEDLNAGIGQFVQKRVPLSLPSYLPNPVNPPPTNQQGRDWIRDWSQEYNDFSGENEMI